MLGPFNGCLKQPALCWVSDKTSQSTFCSVPASSRPQAGYQDSIIGLWAGAARPQCNLTEITGHFIADTAEGKCSDVQCDHLSQEGGQQGAFSTAHSSTHPYQRTLWTHRHHWAWLQEEKKKHYKKLLQHWLFFQCMSSMSLLGRHFMSSVARCSSNTELWARFLLIPHVG